MMNEKITIGILNSNGLNRLKIILPSLLNQTYKNLEILFVDNGSNDGSLEYLKKFRKVKVIKNSTNEGYGKGKNKIVKFSSGKYVLLMDNDIELKDKNFINKIYEEYKKLDNPAFLSPLTRNIGSEYINLIGLHYTKTNKRVKLNKIEKNQIIQVPGYHGSVVFFKKIIFDELGGFDEIYPYNIDDYDLSARAYTRGYKNYITTSLCIIHHGIETRNNLNSLCWKEKYYFCGFSRMIFKNYRWYNILMWWPISIAWIFYKNLKICLNYKSFRPLISFFKSNYYFIRDLADTMKKRSLIQGKRVERSDLFLKL